MKIKKRKALIHFLYLFFFLGLQLATVQAQEKKILRGIVTETTDKGNILPIEGASIHWLYTQSGTTSDSLGHFQLPYHPNSRKLVISYIGFKTDTLLIAGEPFVKVALINRNELGEIAVSYVRKSSEVSFIDPFKTTLMNEKELFKAACCNLSESFETNPSVDVAFSDALTGTKQIQMLGLASQYTLMSQENIPSTRGISMLQGPSFTPGTWLKGIQVTKGQGSVVNGFESMAGQINTELHSTETKERLYLNYYYGAGGRTELNMVTRLHTDGKFRHVLFLHGNTTFLETDHNKDGFMDNPTGRQGNLLYRFRWDLSKGLSWLGGFRVLDDLRNSGQLGVNVDNPGKLYAMKLGAQRQEAWSKLAFTFPRKVYKSMGLQMQFANQNNQARFGKHNYGGQQQSSYINFIYQSIIGTTNHKFKTGFSIQSDRFAERLVQFDTLLPVVWNQQEVVSGAFFEYTLNVLPKFTLVSGIRGDYSSIFNGFITPRLHLRYAISDKTVLRASAGRGRRLASVLGENMTLLASSRVFQFPKLNIQTLDPLNEYPLNMAGFRPEIAWNYGLSLQHEFRLNYRPATLHIDFFHTRFENQLVVDRYEDSRSVYFYNLEGRSYSNNLQIQLEVEPLRRFDIRLAYRLFDTRTQYKSQLLNAPLVAKHRAFANFAYETKNKWSFDYTLQWIGQKPLPSTSGNHHGDLFANSSEAYWLSNVQVSKSFKNQGLDLYIGAENLFNFMQHHAILNASTPFDEYFDATLVWGPVFGRMVYGGMRWKW